MGIEHKSFKFGNIWLGNYGIYLARRVVPVLPRTRDKTVDVPGKDGLVDFGGELGERPLPLPCILEAGSTEEWWSIIRSLTSIFNPANGSQRLIIDEEPDKYIMARYSGQLSIEQLLQWDEFELPLMAYDPYYYSLITDTVVEAITSSGQSINVQKDNKSIKEYPTLRIINSGTTSVSGIKITRVNTP